MLYKIIGFVSFIMNVFANGRLCFTSKKSRSVSLRTKITGLETCHAFPITLDALASVATKSLKPHMHFFLVLTSVKIPRILLYALQCKYPVEV